VAKEKIEQAVNTEGAMATPSDQGPPATEGGSRFSPLRKGNNVFIRTVTHYYTGKVIDVTDDEIVLGEAAWIADTGRFSQALAEGTMNEVEPYPDKTGGLVAIARGCLIDCAPWIHKLPRKSKG
jgi:hypothetical protein